MNLYQPKALYDQIRIHGKKGSAKAIEKVTEIQVNNTNAKVLVHCIEDIDRSPFIIASIIAQQDNIQLREAYMVVKEARPIIHEHYEWLNS